MLRQLFSKISTHSFTGVGVDDVLTELSGWLVPPGAQDELEGRALQVPRPAISTPAPLTEKSRTKVDIKETGSRDIIQIFEQDMNSPSNEYEPVLVSAFSKCFSDEMSSLPFPTSLR